VTPPSHTTPGARATNERVELARCTISAGERVTYGQRVPGVVRLLPGRPVLLAVSSRRNEDGRSRPRKAPPEAGNRAVAGRGIASGGPPIPRPVCGQLTCSLETLIGSLELTGPKVSTA
jgi:hypothetical protein